MRQESARWSRLLGATGVATAALASRRRRGRDGVARQARGGDAASDAVDGWIQSQLKRDDRHPYDTALAERGQAMLEDMKAPARQQEPWRYTDLKALFIDAATTAAPTPEAIQASVAELLETESKDYRLVFVDGVLSPELSTTAEGDAAFIGGAANLKSQEAPIQERLNGLLSSLPELDLFTPDAPRDGLGCATMAAINQSLFEDCACMHLPGDAGASEPGEKIDVEVIFVTTGCSIQSSSPRLLIDVGPNSRLRLFESHLSLSPDDASLSNGVCRVVLGEGATVEHEFLQQKAEGARLVESVTAEVGDAARYELRVVQTGARVGRLNAAIGLQGASSSCDVAATMLGEGQQQLDLHSLIHHSVPGCESRQQHKNIVADTAECIFKGSIRVDKEAQQTQSEQICRTLLLAKKAKVKAMPSLQIQADDVTCSHGAAVTELDQNQVFYMKSRGLSPTDARKLLLVAFPQDLLGDLKDSVPKVYQRIVDKLVNMASKEDA